MFPLMAVKDFASSDDSSNMHLCRRRGKKETRDEVGEVDRGYFRSINNFRVPGNRTNRALETKPEKRVIFLVTCF